MPAAAPPISPELATVLAAAGMRLRLHRKQLGVSAVTAAEAAGISRVTLHRIERGEPSVAMGSYASAAAAIGLDLRFVDPHEAKAADENGSATALPPSIRLADYPQLARLVWQLPDVSEITPGEALELYERNWRHLDPAMLSTQERALIEALARLWGGGRLLV